MAEKKITKKSPPRTVKKETVEEVKTDLCCSPKKPLKKVVLFLAFLVILAGVLGYFFKDKFLVAIVNNKPIFRYTLSQFLIKSSGKDALENLIVENLIQDEVKKNNVLVTDQEIEDEIKKIEDQLGTSVSLENALSMQGMTLEDFREQIKTRLQVYKILENEITVSDEDLNQYLLDNADFLIGTTDEEKRAEASGAIKEQKMNERIQTWVNDLLSQAKITRFLK